MDVFKLPIIGTKYIQMNVVHFRRKKSKAASIVNNFDLTNMVQVLVIPAWSMLEKRWKLSVCICGHKQIAYFMKIVQKNQITLDFGLF